MTDRREGWYWVKRNQAERWECMQWNGAAWCCKNAFGSPNIIGNRIPTPDEPWQCVPREMNDLMREAFMNQHRLHYHERGESDFRPQHTHNSVLAVSPKPDASV